MAKPEIEELIEYLRRELPKFVLEDQKGIFCKITDVYDVIRNYPVESDKTSGPDWEAMYKRCAEELNKAQLQVQSIQFDMHNLSIEHAQYAGAVAAMETIFGRKFEPQR